MALLHRADQARHRIPFWWWITYDALVALVIIVGVKPLTPAFWLGFGTLGIAVVIDSVEFWVKRPANRAKLAPKPILASHPRLMEDAAMQLALAADEVDRHIMDSGLAWRRQRLRDEILNVKLLVEQEREARRAA